MFRSRSILYWGPLAIAAVAILFNGWWRRTWIGHANPMSNYWALVWFSATMAVALTVYFAAWKIRPRAPPVAAKPWLAQPEPEATPPVRVFGAEGPVEDLSETDEAEDLPITYARWAVDAALMLLVLPTVAFVVIWSLAVSIHYTRPLASVAVVVVVAALTRGGWHLICGRELRWEVAGVLLSFILVFLILSIGLPSYEASNGMEEFNLFEFEGALVYDTANEEDIEQAESGEIDNALVPEAIPRLAPEHQAAERSLILAIVGIIPAALGLFAWRYRTGTV